MNTVAACLIRAQHSASSALKYVYITNLCLRLFGSYPSQSCSSLPNITHGECEIRFAPNSSARTGSCIVSIQLDSSRRGIQCIRAVCRLWIRTLRNSQVVRCFILFGFAMISENFFNFFPVFLRHQPPLIFPKAGAKFKRPTRAPLTTNVKPRPRGRTHRTPRLPVKNTPTNEGWCRGLRPPWKVSLALSTTFGDMKRQSIITLVPYQESSPVPTPRPLHIT